MSTVDVCRISIDSVLEKFYDPKFYYGGCPNATLNLLSSYKIDTSKRSTECQNKGCYMAFNVVAGWQASLTDFSCPITDIATNNVVSAVNINCTTKNPAETVVPVPTLTFAPKSSTSTPETTSVGATTSPASVPSPESSSPIVNGSNKSTSSSSSTLIIVIAAVVVVVLVGGFLMWRRRAKKSTGDSFHVLGDDQKGTKSTGASTNPASKYFDSDATDQELLSMWNIPGTELSMERRIAEGAFGEVWLATYMGQSVAVKTLHKTKSSIADVKVFIEEIKLIAKFDCPSIVQFLGVSFYRIIDIMLVTEFMNGGDLRNALIARDSNSFPLVEKLEIALRISDALVYLHVLDPKVIHRDLKSRNVLLDPVKGAKVTDFGVSREALDAETLTQGVGTYRWMAPEVLSDGHYTTSADIFSFGIILSELDTHQVPYSDLKNPNGNPLSDTAIMAQVMKGTLQPSFRPDAASWFVDFAKKCINIDPLSRPTAMEVSYFIRMQLRNISK